MKEINYKISYDLISKEITQDGDYNYIQFKINTDKLNINTQRIVIGDDFYNHLASLTGYELQESLLIILSNYICETVK